MSLPEHAQYKFLLHLDGTAASNRLLKLLFMGSVVLKQVAHMPGEKGRAKCVSLVSLSFSRRTRSMRSFSTKT